MKAGIPLGDLHGPRGRLSVRLPAGDAVNAFGKRHLGRGSESDRLEPFASVAFVPSAIERPVALEHEGDSDPVGIFHLQDAVGELPRGAQGLRPVPDREAEFVAVFVQCRHAGKGVATPVDTAQAVDARAHGGRHAARERRQRRCLIPPAASRRRGSPEPLPALPWSSFGSSDRDDPCPSVGLVADGSAEALPEPPSRSPDSAEFLSSVGVSAEPCPQVDFTSLQEPAGAALLQAFKASLCTALSLGPR